MSKHDLRKVPRETRDKIHLLAVDAVLKDGRNIIDVADFYGVSRQSISTWLKRFKHSGKKALKSGKAKGNPRCLSPEEETILVNNIYKHSPDNFNMSGMLWTREHCCRLAKKLFKKEVSLSAMGRLLRRKNMSNQKPLKKAYEQNAKAVDKWKKTTFPEIKKEAHKIRASIFFSDETGVRSESHSGTTWGKKGKTPVVKKTGKRLRLNVIGAMSRRGDFKFMIFSEKMTGKKFVEYLKRLMHKRRRPIFLIVDSHPAHKSKIVKEYLNTQNGKLRLFFLPPYSPELNPQEYGWNAMKTRKVSSARVSTQSDLTSAVRSCLRKWQSNPRLVKGFFRSKETRYAA